jgi:hypothetical protein
LLLQSHEAFDKESLPPSADDLTAAVEAGSNLLVGQSPGGQQDHPGTLDLKIR